MSHPHHKLGNWANSRLANARVPERGQARTSDSPLRRGYSNLMPSLKSQLVGPTLPPDDLEERAWAHYFKYHKSPVSPELINLIKLLLVEEDAQKRT
jgi:hypothetical protein